jgi:peptidoglycan/xylan/chitin deacetylase (PgdA/CDA1 family)
MASSLVISLDFELLWGVRDHSDRQSYGANVLGAREAIPRMLEIFEKNGVRATWATVGFLFCETKEELIASLPELRPAYRDQRLSNYTYLDEVGEDERRDPYYFGASLVSRIRQTPGQEIGTHTLSHFYCLEDGQADDAFRADLSAAIKIAQRHRITLKSIVFPRNQFSDASLSICREQGLTHFRGNPDGWAYRAVRTDEQTKPRRALRLLDAYTGLLGAQGFTARNVAGLIDVPASRFLRPCAGKLAPLHPLHLATIKRGMATAAKEGKGYHLWWHPHNFGKEMEANLRGLGAIIKHFRELRDRFGMVSSAMEDFS